MKHYFLTPEAEADFDDIWMYIAADNIESATRWTEKLEAEFDKLEKNPRLGHSRDDLTDYPVLFWAVKSYLIIYLNKDPIEIVAVTHGARDISALLNKRLTSH